MALIYADDFNVSGEITGAPIYNGMQWLRGNSGISNSMPVDGGELGAAITSSPGQAQAWLAHANPSGGVYSNAYDDYYFTEVNPGSGDGKYTYQTAAPWTFEAIVFIPPTGAPNTSSRMFFSPRLEYDDFNAGLKVSPGIELRMAYDDLGNYASAKIAGGGGDSSWGFPLVLNGNASIGHGEHSLRIIGLDFATRYVLDGVTLYTTVDGGGVRAGRAALSFSASAGASVDPVIRSVALWEGTDETRPPPPGPEPDPELSMDDWWRSLSNAMQWPG